MAAPGSDCCFREQMKFALYTKFREPRLYRCAARGDWEEIPQRCRSHPKEAKFVHRYPPSDTALHQVLRFPRLDSDFDCDASRELQSLKVDAIRALLEANRNAASTTDSLGRAPLHLACMDLFPSELDAITSLLEAWPRACAHLDMEGRTPLHYLVARNDAIPIPFLVRLVQAYPDAVHVADMVGETPLQILNARTSDVYHAEAAIRILNTGEAP